jgi:putative aminopeptidase FrvX
MDEIGLMVTHVDESSFARFTPWVECRPGTAPASVRFDNASVIGLERSGGR